MAVVGSAFGFNSRRRRPWGFNRAYDSFSIGIAATVAIGPDRIGVISLQDSYIEVKLLVLLTFSKFLETLYDVMKAMIVTSNERFPLDRHFP